MFQTIDIDCVNCINDCKNKHCGSDKCHSFTELPSKKDIKHLGYLLAKKKIRLKTICKQNHLRLDSMKRMMQLKENFTHRYYTVLKKSVSDHWSEEDIEKYSCKFEAI